MKGQLQSVILYKGVEHSWILVFEAEDHDYAPGDYFTVEITGLDEYDFVGEIVDELTE